MGTLCVCAQPWSRRARQVVLAAVTPWKGVLALCACLAHGLSGWTSTGCQARTQAPLMAPHGCWTAFWPSWAITASSTTRTTSAASVEILGHLTGRARAWAAPYLDGDLPLPDDYELFCQDLEEVIQDPNNFAEYHAAVPCPLPPASSQPPVAPQLPVVRQYLARFSEALPLNMGASPRPVPATPAVSSSSSTSGNALPEHQLAKESIPESLEPPALSSSACSTNPGPLGPASSQAEEVAPKPVPELSEPANPPAQKPNPALPGGPEPQNTEEKVSETQETRKQP